MKSRFAAIGLLLLLAWLELSTLASTSPTVDEPLHIMRASAYVRRDEERYLMYGPVLPNALSGLGLLAEPDLQLYPVDDPIWNNVAGMQHPNQFIWNNTVPPERIFFWGRLPIIAVSLLLGAFIFRWARERTNGAAAVGALALYVFSPNLLAHSRLATTDSMTAATFLIGTYAFDKALRAPRWNTLYPDQTTTRSIALPVSFGDAADLIGFEIGPGASANDWAIISYWRARGPIKMPLRGFMHAIAANGQIAAQDDRLDVNPKDWRAGDLFAQVSRLTIPSDAGPVWIEAGLYNPDSGERLPVKIDRQEVDQRVLLGLLEAR